VILHYNRPWLLKAHIDLIRHFCPSVSEIIIADDGSDSRVINYISKIGANDVYVQKNHLHEWDKSSASNTLINSIKRCKNKYISFSEDDFFVCPSGIDDSSFYNNGEYPSGKISGGCDPLEDCLFLFKNQRAIIIQPSRDANGWKGVPCTGKTRANKSTWCQIDHEKKKRFYYSNWPWVMQYQVAKHLDIPRDSGMWRVESHLNKWMTKNFGNGNWNWCAQKRMFIHVGLPFSKKDMRYSDNTEKSMIRNEQSKAFADSIGHKQNFENINDFNNIFLEKWLEKKSEILVQSLSENGIKNTFERFATEVMS
jgi:glycosyltransferase involved in cell wall biosynthesis